MTPWLDALNNGALLKSCASLRESDRNELPLGYRTYPSETRIHRDAGAAGYRFLVEIERVWEKPEAAPAPAAGFDATAWLEDGTFSH